VISLSNTSAGVEHVDDGSLSNTSAGVVLVDDDWKYISSVFLSRSGEMMRREALDSTMRLAAVMVERRMVIVTFNYLSLFFGVWIFRRPKVRIRTLTQGNS
jgi:hypothetical protein